MEQPVRWPWLHRLYFQSALLIWETDLSTIANLVKISSVSKRWQEGESTEQNQSAGKGWRITCTLSWLRSMCTYIYCVWRLFLLFKIRCCSWAGLAGAAWSLMSTFAWCRIVICFFEVCFRYCVFFRGHTWVEGQKTAAVCSWFYSSKTMANVEACLTCAS